MQKKIEAEEEKETELYDKFMCYCQNGAGALKASVDAAETKIPQVEAEISTKTAEKAQLESDIVQHKADREAAKTAMAEATSLREKEAAAFATESTETKTNIAATGKAITAVEKGMGSAFLQTAAASELKKFVLNGNLDDDQRETITAFLSEDDSYAPQSGQITGILKQMKDTMEASLSDAEKAEAVAIANYEELMKAKTKEIAAATEAIEDKVQRTGSVAAEVVNLKEDLDDTQKALAEDKAFAANLDSMCATKQKEWAARQEMRGEEKLALADTINLLNDDDALELFKKTLPSASLLQVTVSSHELLKSAAAILKVSHKGKRDPRMSFLALALRGKSVDMSKFVKMMEEMIDTLNKEQETDDSKKEHCEKEFDMSEDEKKTIERAIGKIEAAIAENKEAIAALTADIEALAKGIKESDKDVAEATEQRKEENEDYQTAVAANSAAVELIGVAKNRMNKFYNPKLYKAAPKREITEDERNMLAAGGTLAPTTAPGGIAGTGVTVFLQTSKKEAPPPPPETFGAYAKKSGESGGVIAMMDGLIADVEKELHEMEFEEKDAQKDYERFMKDSAEKRADDSKAMANKGAVKADTEATLQKNEEALHAKMAEAMSNGQYIAQLHGECDWLISNFETRKEMRAEEVENLHKAIATLQGADYALVQKASRSFLRKVSQHA